MSRLYNTSKGLILESNGSLHSLGNLCLDTILTSNEPVELIESCQSGTVSVLEELLAPIQSQEVWAAGVTYFRSRTARMEESAEAGGADFYERVYDAERPEIFFKANPHHTVGPGGEVRIRKDSKWNVPEPELTLCISQTGEIVGYTIGNDMSSRDIEGENPLYLPQAKTYDQACALGPCILLSKENLPVDTEIMIEVKRSDAVAFSGRTSLDQMKRTPNELVGFLTRENSFPKGGFLMTGTGIIPENDFSLASGDEIAITIEPIGTLKNTVG